MADIVIEIPVSENDAALFEAAASLSCKSTGAFVRAAAISAAIEIHLGRRAFCLSAEGSHQLSELLKHPPEPTDALRQLMSTAAPWEEPAQRHS